MANKKPASMQQGLFNSPASLTSGSLNSVSESSEKADLKCYYCGNAGHTMGTCTHPRALIEKLSHPYWTRMCSGCHQMGHHAADCRALRKADAFKKSGLSYDEFYYPEQVRNTARSGQTYIAPETEKATGDKSITIQTNKGSNLSAIKEHEVILKQTAKADTVEALTGTKSLAAASAVLSNAAAEPQVSLECGASSTGSSAEHNSFGTSEEGTELSTKGSEISLIKLPEPLIEILQTRSKVPVVSTNKIIEGTQEMTSSKDHTPDNKNLTKASPTTSITSTKVVQLKTNIPTHKPSNAIQSKDGELSSALDQNVSANKIAKEANKTHEESNYSSSKNSTNGAIKRKSNRKRKGKRSFNPLAYSQPPVVEFQVKPNEETSEEFWNALDKKELGKSDSKNEAVFAAELVVEEHWDNSDPYKNIKGYNPYKDDVIWNTVQNNRTLPQDCEGLVRDSLRLSIKNAPRWQDTFHNDQAHKILSYAQPCREFQELITIGPMVMNPLYKFKLPEANENKYGHTLWTIPHEVRGLVIMNLHENSEDIWNMARTCQAGLINISATVAIWDINKGDFCGANLKRGIAEVKDKHQFYPESFTIITPIRRDPTLYRKALRPCQELHNLHKLSLATTYMRNRFRHLEFHNCHMIDMKMLNSLIPLLRNLKFIGLFSCDLLHIGNAYEILEIVGWGRKKSIMLDFVPRHSFGNHNAMGTVNSKLAMPKILMEVLSKSKKQGAGLELKSSAFYRHMINYNFISQPKVMVHGEPFPDVWELLIERSQCQYMLAYMYSKKNWAYKIGSGPVPLNSKNAEFLECQECDKVLRGCFFSDTEIQRYRQCGMLKCWGCYLLQRLDEAVSSSDDHQERFRIIRNWLYVWNMDEAIRSKNRRLGMKRVQTYENVMMQKEEDDKKRRFPKPRKGARGQFT
ncbi:MAG: hypothetical protein M1829_003416 [Trizodia sp. TS-e1964]|nr:MAG: hypothetical protein M1829_003416 [Trizodia sp. TS-e1964]